MIDLEKDDFIFNFYNRDRIKNKLIFSCYKDLFEQNNKPAYIIEYIERDTNISITYDVIRYIRRVKKEIPCYYNPLWRNKIETIQKGEKVKKLIEKPISNTTEFKPFLSSQLNTDLPDNYVRVPNDFKEKRYHKSLKNYIFNYPWFQLDDNGIPRPAQVGKTNNDRLRWLLDVEEYDEIVNSYVMPEELANFKKKFPSVFKGYVKDGFPHSRGGYHPNNEIYNN